MTWTECITLTKDLILSGAAITGAVVAVKGLGTWRRQLKGKTEHDLSKHLLVSLFKYRDAIRGVRNPAIYTHEIPKPPEDKAKSMNPDQISFYGTAEVYQARWSKVQDERVKLYADLLEAEALWGEELNKLFKVIYDLEHELFTYIRRYLELSNPDVNNNRKDAVEKFQQKSRNIMYGDLGDEDDEFWNDVMVGIESIEKYLKPKLSH